MSNNLAQGGPAHVTVPEYAEAEIAARRKAAGMGTSIAERIFLSTLGVAALALIVAAIWRAVF